MKTTHKLDHSLKAFALSITTVLNLLGDKTLIGQDKDPNLCLWTSQIYKMSQVVS